MLVPEMQPGLVNLLVYLVYAACAVSGNASTQSKFYGFENGYQFRSIDGVGLHVSARVYEVADA